MRGGNFLYLIEGLVLPLIVHRGVSQGGRKLTPGQLVNFWHKHRQEVSGVDAGNDGTVTVSLTGLQALRARSLVVVSNPDKPQVWTVRRIMESAERVPIMSAPAPEQSACQRRGRLKL